MRDVYTPEDKQKSALVTPALVDGTDVTLIQVTIAANHSPTVNRAKLILDSVQHPLRASKLVWIVNDTSELCSWQQLEDNAQDTVYEKLEKHETTPLSSMELLTSQIRGHGGQQQHNDYSSRFSDDNYNENQNNYRSPRAKNRRRNNGPRNNDYSNKNQKNHKQKNQNYEVPRYLSENRNHKSEQRYETTTPGIAFIIPETETTAL
jgi:hypothetical protein